MTIHFRLALAAFILTASTPGATAQDSAVPAAPKTEQGISGARTTIHLSTDQEKAVWQRINNHPTASPPLSQSIVPVGEVVPKEIPLQAIPEDVAAEVAALKGYDYTIMQDRLLIVSRTDTTVAYIINGTLRRNY